MTVTHSGEESDKGQSIELVNRVSLRPTLEPGLAISKREYARQIERLKGCKPRGWSDLWLAGGGVGSGLAASALVTMMSLDPTAPQGVKAKLWMLLIIGVVVAVLSVLAYFTQQHDRGKEINELTTDMEMYMKQSGSTPTRAPAPSPARVARRKRGNPGPT